MTPFSELTKQVHLINDLILGDLAYGQEDYADEYVTFSKHLLATKYWFARISFANKKRYILALLFDVRSAWTFSLLLKSMWNCRPKDAVLSGNETTAWSSYDQVPIDNNRTAQPVKTLAQVMQTDRKWFHNLDPESQAMVISELVTVAGGPIMWEVLRKAERIYYQYREHQLKSLLECILVNEQPLTIKNEAPPQPPPKSHSPASEDPYDDGLKSLPKRKEAQKELENSLAQWNATIKSIRDSQKLEEMEMTFNDGTKRKIWKVNRVKPEGVETVDFVQLLPAYIGKCILSYLPRAQLGEYAKVNKYWAFLVDEFKMELVARQKLNTELEKLKELMVRHDTSLEVIAPVTTYSTGRGAAPSSIGTSAAPSVKARSHISAQPSMRASERSGGGYSIRHFMSENKKQVLRKRRPLRNLAEVTERLERRGAADEHLWEWCENVLKQSKKVSKVEKKEEEGVLRFRNMHFPCPMMKKSIEIPLEQPLLKDPSNLTSAIPRYLKRNISNANLNLPKDNVEFTRRYHLWSRDFSSLYKVFKVPSYQSPV